MRVEALGLQEAFYAEETPLCGEEALVICGEEVIPRGEEALCADGVPLCVDDAA